jgi:hypothetical protein
MDRRVRHSKDARLEDTIRKWGGGGIRRDDIPIRDHVSLCRLDEGASK